MSWFDLEEIQDIAPDAKAVTAARKITKPSKWKRLGRHDEHTLWGIGLGSKGDHYAVLVTSERDKLSCSCPSRKRPCKHVLALLLLELDGFDFEDSPLPTGHRYTGLLAT